MKNKSETIKIKKKYIIILLITFILVYLLININYQKNKEQNNEHKTEITDQFSNIKEPHFTNSTVTYSLNISTRYGLSEKSNTDNYKVERIKWALNLLENATDNLVEFKEVKENENPNIMIYGVPEIDCYLENETFTGIIEGFASPNLTENKIIDSLVVYCAKIYIQGYANEAGEVEGIGENNIGFSWYDGACEDFPLVEIHELLHAFGFGHNYNNNKEIMYPINFRIKSCEIDSINKKINSCLKYIYSNGKIKGDCSDLNMFPWSEEIENFTDFRWENLPVTYSIFDCKDRQKWNLNFAERILEKFSENNLLEFKEQGGAQINFYCKSKDDVLLNEETDLWSTTNYFPAAQPEYFFEDGIIKEVRINILNQDRNCGGIELHELLHGLGLRNHYGDWMFYERGVCSNDGVIDKKSINELKKLYRLE